MQCVFYTNPKQLFSQAQALLFPFCQDKDQTHTDIFLLHYQHHYLKTHFIALFFMYCLQDIRPLNLAMYSSID